MSPGGRGCAFYHMQDIKNIEVVLVIGSEGRQLVKCLFNSKINLDSFYHLTSSPHQ